MKTKSNFKSKTNGTSTNKGANRRNKSNNRRQQFNANSVAPDGGIRCLDNTGDTNSMNDVSWYTRYPDLIEPLAKIPFPYKPGMDIKLGTLTYSQKTNDGINTKTTEFVQRIPGVMVLSWYPTVGQTDGPTSPVGLMAKEIYSKIRQQYSGSLDADAPDFVMYLYALDSIYSYIGGLKRIYRALDSYDRQNYFLPNGILAGAGMNENTVAHLRVNKANFREMINQLIRMTDRFKVPSEIDLFVRHYWMNDHIYLDAPDKMGQFYMFRQDAFYMYKEQGTVTDDNIKAAGMELIDAPWFDLKDLTVADLYDFGHRLIVALSEWDDSYTISGYLMRGYEGSPEFTVTSLTDGEDLQATYSPEVLMQIHNSFPIGTQVLNDFAGVDRYLSDVTVRQDPTTNAVHASLRGAEGGFDLQDEYDDFTPVFNMASPNPTPADILVASRLKASVYRDDEDWATWIVGTEIPVAWFMIAYDEDHKLQRVPYPTIAKINRSPYISSSVSTGASDTYQAIYGLMLASHFDWAPLSIAIMHDYDVSGTTNLAYAPVINLFGDIRNVAPISKENLAELHRVCMLSELNSFR